MNNLLAVLPAGLAAIAFLLGWLYGPALVRRVRLFLSYPDYGLTALCPHCVTPLPFQECPLCPACRTPITSIATYDPIMRIASMGALYRRASKHLMGFGLAGVLFMAFGPLLIAVLLKVLQEDGFGIMLFMVAAPWLLILAKAISNHGKETDRAGA